jgi:hypothetical protein
VSGTVTAGGAQFETYLYKIVGPLSEDVLAWFPDTQDRARVAFTSVGPSEFNVAVEPDNPVLGRVWLRAVNNPGRGGITFVTDAPDHRATEVEVYDLKGRLVARLMTAGGGGGQVARWDGGDLRGLRCAAGVYLARVRWSSDAANCRFILLR